MNKLCVMTMPQLKIKWRFITSHKLCNFHHDREYERWNTLFDLSKISANSAALHNMCGNKSASLMGRKMDSVSLSLCQLSSIAFQLFLDQILPAPCLSPHLHLFLLSNF